MAFFLLLPLRTQEIMQESLMTAVYLRSPGLQSVKRIQPSALISGLIYPLLTPFSRTLYSSALNWQDGGKLWVTWGCYGAQGWKWIDWPFCVPVFLRWPWSVSQTSPASPASLHVFCLPRALCPDLASSNHSLLAPGYFPQHPHSALTCVPSQLDSLPPTKFSLWCPFHS